jgi:DNA-binding NarL/FixJ family response regulator
MAIRVLIADDHALVRSGLKALLERTPDIHVAAEAAQALALNAQQRPDVMPMDRPNMKHVTRLGRHAIRMGLAQSE